MADKRQIRHTIKTIQRIKTWQLLILLVLAALLTATFLRLNNVGMIQRRTAVINADKESAERATADALYALQAYSAAHMNADSGAIYLEGSYKRDSQAVAEKAAQASNISAKIVKEADNVCKQQFSGWSEAYVQCFAAEQNKHKGQAHLQPVVFPNPELYRHEYISPLWSPDFAGFSLLLCLLITLVIILRLISYGILRLLLRRHYSAV